MSWMVIGTFLLLSTVRNTDAFQYADTLDKNFARHGAVRYFGGDSSRSAKDYFLQDVNLMTMKERLVANRENLTSSTTGSCLTDTMKLLTDLLNPAEFYPVFMLDSYAKPESGSIFGNSHWPGLYEQCVNVSKKKT